ncbi:nucleoside hydrolase [Novipirellula artificiosorum]|uniref:nucleoside hydrolase n=1 Tax=Novipirellula artificiosorum TaxID=2528016 RepID=UPI0018CD2C5D|nr:nucleoside hydrolase [Novipirellula artificiosorum]
MNTYLKARAVTKSLLHLAGPGIVTLAVMTINLQSSFGQKSDSAETGSNPSETRGVPQVPAAGERLPLLIDSDVANEIDDLYAITLALAANDRFELKGMVATHFAQWAGPDSTDQSYELLQQLLEVSGNQDQFPVARGGDPMQYTGVPTSSQGADLIIKLARQASPQEPLWVVVLGAATNTASAILQAPSIKPNIRVIFHARCAQYWPQRTVQFNVVGDVIAVQTLLSSRVPLVWFDTGTELTIPYDETKSRLAPMGATGKFLHEFRDQKPEFAKATKGFFDMGDIAWLMDPSLCKMETVPAPLLRRNLGFDKDRTYGNMLRVSEIDVSRTWQLFFETLDQSTKIQ